MSRGSISRFDMIPSYKYKKVYKFNFKTQNDYGVTFFCGYLCEFDGAF